MTGDGVRTFEWDAEDRLVAVSQGLLRSEFTYDGLDRRVRIVELDNGSVTTQKNFLWMGNTIAEERDATGDTVTKRFFGQGVQVGTLKFYYVEDHLGSIREMTDSLGGVVARYGYDPYGVRSKISGSGDADFGFTGHYLHGPSGLYLTKYRAYDPGEGRWISRDPIGELAMRSFSGHPKIPNPVLPDESLEYDDLDNRQATSLSVEGLNLYGYVGNDPMNFTDPLGLEEEHTKNKRKSTKEKHENAKAKKEKREQKKADRKEGKGPGGKKFRGWRGFLPLMIPYCLIDPSLCKDPPPSCEI